MGDKQPPGAIGRPTPAPLGPKGVSLSAASGYTLPLRECVVRVSLSLSRQLADLGAIAGDLPSDS